MDEGGEMIRKNGFTFGPEAMAHNIGKFPRTRVGYKPDTMTRVKMKVGSAKRHMSDKPVTLSKPPWEK